MHCLYVVLRKVFQRLLRRHRVRPGCAEQHRRKLLERGLSVFEAGRRRMDLHPQFSQTVNLLR